MDLELFTEKLSKSPWSLVIATVVMVMTVLGSHFATTGDLDDLNNSVIEIREELGPLQTRVTTLERDVDGLDRDIIKVVEQNESLARDYHKIDVSLERMSGRQDITNERLENLRTLLRYGYEFEERNPTRR